MELRLIAGNPNDENRDYVPEAIKGTDMTVNENGNNSQVYPANLQEFTGVVADGLEDRWYEYVPSCYDGSKAVPLVVSNHGGLMTGWAQAVYSSWTVLAEKENFICVFPDAPVLQMWNIQGMKKRLAANPDLVLPMPKEPDDYHDNHDMNFVKALIGEMCRKYNIDTSRIYMQGMSMGHMMTDQFARFYGDMLAGAAGSGASAMGTELYDDNGNLINYGGPIPMWISHPEFNSMDAFSPDENAAQKTGREYWMKVNGITGKPQIKIQGEDNFAFYKGEKADLCFLDIKNRDHGQALDEAFYYWNYMFAGCSRAADGTIVRTKTPLEPVGDQAIALTEGSKNAWVNNEVVSMNVAPVRWEKLKYHGLNGGQMVRGEYLCVSLRFLAEVFGAQYETENNGLEATMTLKDGRVLKFARGVIGCMMDDNMYSMYCETLHRENELLVSVEWFCKFVLNMTVTSANGVVYVTDHFAELANYMAEIIKDLLK